MKKLNKTVICQLVNALIEDESKARHEYTEILEAIPKDDEYKEFIETIIKIKEDEINHGIMLIEMGKKLKCKEPNLTDDDAEFFKIVSHIH